jgi:chromosomal replication initiator protein
MRFGVELRQLRSPDRHPNLVWPRQLTMHLARSLTTLSLAQIGEFFGRDHSTVRHACQKVDDALAIDAELPGLLRELSAELC